MSTSAPAPVPASTAVSTAVATTAATTKPKTGRNQASASAAANFKTPNLSHYYRHFLPAIHPDDFEFHLDLLIEPSYSDAPANPLPKSLTVFPLDPFIDTLSWSDEQSTLTGTITLRRPVPDDPLSLPIIRNQWVRCRVKWGGQTYELWTMKTDPPQIELDTNTVTVTLQDDMVLLDTGKQDWSFRATKRRPHGFFVEEIAREIAKTLGVRVGKLAQGTKRISFSKNGATGLDAIKAAYAEERKASGRFFVVRMRFGKLEVVPLQYNPLLYELGDEIQTALITQKAGSKAPVTVLEGTGHVGKGKKTKKLKFTASNRNTVKAFGWVKDKKDFGLVKSHGDLRDQVKRELAKGLRLQDTISVTHAGLPFIQRGDAVQIRLPNEGYAGIGSFVWVTRAQHTVQAGVYSTQWDLNATDAVIAAKQAQLKAEQARTSNNTATSATTQTGSGQRWAVTASQESLGGTGSCGGGIVADGYSELSTVPQGTGSDFHALGGLPCGTQLVITNPANGQSVTTGKQDVGAGSSFLPVMGLYPGTTGKLGLSGGEYHIIIQRADGGPLKPVRGSPA